MSQQHEKSERNALHVSLDVADPGESISGRLDRPDGESVLFSGWMGLVAAIEEAAARPADPGGTGGT